MGVDNVVIFDDSQELSSSNYTIVKNNDLCTLPRMAKYSADQRRKALKAFMEERGLKVKPWCVAAGLTESSVRHFLKGRAESLKDDTYEALAMAAQVSAAVLRGERVVVPVVHKVGAGAEVFPIDDHEKGSGLDEVEAPPGADEATLAAVVVGDSMLPAYRPGDIILYRRNHGEDFQAYVGRDVVAHLHDGRTFLKFLKRVTKTTANLGSHNAPDIDGARIEWIAPVLWVKRAGAS